MDAPPASTFEKHVKALGASPLFNLSLGSKELFHSDFLAWLCKLYPTLVGPVFAHFVKSPPPSCAGLQIHRERRNIDLTIQFQNDHALIVENKVKSLPSQSQLVEYSEAVKDKAHTAFLLLSLTRPSFFPPDSAVFFMNGVTWHHLSYSDLAAALEAISSPVSAVDRYHGELIKDYVAFVTSLVAIAAELSPHWEDEETDFFRKDESILLRQIRLHDLMSKIRYAELAERLKQSLIADGWRVVPKDDIENATPGDFMVFSDFYRGEATCEFKYLVRGGQNPVALSVMLQGNAFKVFVGVPRRPDAAQRIANELNKVRGSGRLWFDLSIVEGGMPEMPARGFNQYIRTWLYRYKRIERIAPRRLVEIFVQYARLIREKESAIRNEIEKAYESG